MSLVVFVLFFLLLLGTVLRPAAFVYVVFILGPLPIGAFLRSPSVSTGLGPIHINALLALAILIVSFIGSMFRISESLRQMRTVWLFFVFLAFCAISVIWAADISMAVRMMLKLMAPIVFMVFVAANIRQIGIDTVMRAIIVSGVVYALATIACWGLGLTLNGEFGLPATARSVTSGHLLAPLSVAFVSLLTNPSLARASLTIFFAVTILAGFTRITIAGAFGALGTVFFTKTKGIARTALLVTGVLAFVALFTLVGEFRERMFLEKADRMSFGSVIEDPGSAIAAIGGSGRFVAWDYAIGRLFSPHPIIGSGIGSAQRLFYDPMGLGTSAVHSEVLRLLCDVGIIGLLLYVLAWAQVLWVISRRRRAHPHGDSAKLATAAAAAGVAYLIFLLTDNGFDYVGQIGVFVYGLIGATLGFRPPPPAAEGPTLQPEPAKPDGEDTEDDLLYQQGLPP